MREWRFPKGLIFIGVLPFFVMTALLWRDGADTAVWGAGLVSYAALMLSFLGGIHWGFALTGAFTGNARNMMFIESAVFVLAAWTITFSSIILSYKLIGMMLLYGNLWVADKLYVRRIALPEWFLPARALATAAVMVSLVLAAGATL